MKRVLRHLALTLAAVAGLSLLGTTPAHALVTIQASTASNMSGAVTLGVPGANFSSFTGSFGGVTIVALSGASNSSGTPSLAEVLSATLNLRNTNSTSRTIYLTIGDTGFMSPTAPPPILVDSFIGGSRTGSVGFTFQSFIDASNAQNSITSPLFTAPQIFAAGSGSFSNDAFLTINTLGSPYSITEYLCVTLAGNSSINFGGRTDLTPTPEPSSMAIAGLGALGLIGYGIRRRRGA